MPKFDSSMVSDVEYDFTGFKGCKGSPFEGRSIESQGEIPEPSPEMMSQTMTRITTAFQSMDLGEVEETPESVSAAMSKINDEKTFSKMARELEDALTELCDGSPNRDALTSLGWRRFMAFVGYIMKEMMSPELSNDDSSSTQNRLRSV